MRAALGDLGTVVPVAQEGAGDVVGWGSEGMALVRPDGYLGLVADSTDPDVLRRYLAGALRLTRSPQAFRRHADDAGLDAGSAAARASRSSRVRLASSPPR